jgi:holliday junction DNA helicase RuvB
MTERVISAEGSREEEAIDRAIRPKRLADYVGQRPVKEQLVRRAVVVKHLITF